jgi:hypothetical protein
VDSQLSKRLALVLSALAGTALLPILAGLMLNDTRLLKVGVLLLVCAPLIALAVAGVGLLRLSRRIGVTALVTVAIAVLGALFGR